ncbi:MFS transporter superfamily, partial [Klenkia terrae]
VGSAIAAYSAGVVRDVTGTYDAAWYGAALLCLVAAGLSVAIRTGRAPEPAPAPEEAAAEDAVLRG